METPNLKGILKELNGLATPLMFNLVFGLIVSFINRAMIGRLSIDAIGIVGAVDSLLFTIAGIVGVVAITFNVYGSRALGKKNEKQFELYFSSAIMLNIFLGVLIAIVIFVFQRLFLSTVFGFEGINLENSIMYLSIMSVYPLFQIILFSFSTFFKIKQATKYIFICSTISTILNLFLNYLLIFGNFGFPQLEIIGVAIATLISLSANVLLCALIIKGKVNFIYDIKKLYKHIVLFIKESRFLALQEVLEGSVFFVGINAFLSHMGLLEAYVQIMLIISIAFATMHIYATATLVIIGRNVNSKKIYLLKIPKIAVIVSSFTSLILGILFFAFRFEVIYFLSPNAEFAHLTAGLLKVTIVANMLSPAYIIYKASLQALKQSEYVLYGTFLINAITFILIGILVLYLELGYMGVVVGIFLNYLILAILFYLKYTRSISLSEIVKN